MAEILTKVIVDCATGDTQILPLTIEELDQRDADIAAYEAQKAIEDAAAAKLEAAKTVAREKLVTGEPLTEEEATLLVP